MKKKAKPKKPKAVKAAAGGKKASKKKRKLAKGASLAYLGLGSNVGDREEFIEQAIFLLGKTSGIRVLKRSTNYETEAEGGEEQPHFMNAAVEIETMLPPLKLLPVLQDIETALGRERDVEWGPRPIDIDIFLYGDKIVSEDNLQIPHPLLHERIFALRPLREIAPDAVHPILEKTIEDLYDEKKQEGHEKYDDELPGFKEIKRGVADDYERW